MIVRILLTNVIINSVQAYLAPNDKLKFFFVFFLILIKYIQFNSDCFLYRVHSLIHQECIQQK